MGWLQGFRLASASSAWTKVSPKEREEWDARGAAILNAPMVSAVCRDEDLDMSLAEDGSALLASRGLCGAVKLACRSCGSQV